MNTVPSTRRYHRIDGWRGYTIPRLAILGASDTGTADDSPCPTPQVLAEIARFRREALRPAGIRSRSGAGLTTNVFCQKRWLTVAAADFPRAAQLATDWIAEHDHELRYLHSADLEKLGYRPAAAD